MLLIAAALAEELQTVLNLYSRRRKTRSEGVPVWTGTRAGVTLQALKLGAGPARSSSTLEKALNGLKPSRILVMGYAGALDPDLKRGELVVVSRASLLTASADLPLSRQRIVGTWPLANADDLFSLAQDAGLPVHLGTILTSAGIIGDPEQKRVLYENFHAEVVDMETAALARVASGRNIPLSCVRAITDEAGDDFLAPFSYDPAGGPLRLAAKALTAGNLLGRYGKWREGSQTARQSMTRFLTRYLMSVSELERPQ